MTDVPSDLKAVSPYLARARELTKAEPVIAYWCAPTTSFSPHLVPSLPFDADPPPPALLMRTGTFYALQQAMSLGSKAPESQTFLLGLMDQLEEVRRDSHSVALGRWGVLTSLSACPPCVAVQSKAANQHNEAFTDDVAASAYIENFGLKLFSQADNEDRKGKATRRASALVLPQEALALTPGHGRAG